MSLNQNNNVYYSFNFLHHRNYLHQIKQFLKTIVNQFNNNYLFSVFWVGRDGIGYLYMYIIVYVIISLCKIYYIKYRKWLNNICFFVEISIIQTMSLRGGGKKRGILLMFRPFPSYFQQYGILPPSPIAMSKFFF